MNLFVWIVGYNFENELVAGRITNLCLLKNEDHQWKHSLSLISVIAL